ncbi:hypothetical protein HOF65_06825 [bacterium]|nr:hypothetical protein [bacterium]MBT6778703.1 hypothetical protein [bacterium]
MSTYHQLFLIISTIQSKYTFNNNKALSDGIFSVIVVNHIISKNITFKYFFTDNQREILSVPFSPISFSNHSGINL